MQSLKGLAKSLIVTDNDIRKATRAIPMDAYKYSRGAVLIITGTKDFRGAAILATTAANNATAALVSVSGYVTVAAPEKLAVYLSRLSPAFVIKILKSNTARQISTIKHNAIVLGPGIQEPYITQSTIKSIVALEKKNNIPIIADANVLGMMAKSRIPPTVNMIVTPHDGEFTQLTGRNLKGKGLSERVKAAKDFAKMNKCVLVLKGHDTIIIQGKRMKINVAKTPALATLGTGDVLSGMIASYAAQHDDNFESAVAAVHAHSLIGDKLYKKKGSHITAQDVVDTIPEVLKQFDNIR